MFCPNCGKENAQASGYCSSCGRPLTPIPGTAPVAGPVPAPGFSPPLSVPKKSNSTVIAVIVIVVAGIIGGIAFLVTHMDREPPEQRIGRLMREASGAQPIKKSFFSRDQQFDDTFREQYKNLIQANRDYIDAVKHADMSATRQLGSPESFADPASFADGLKQLHALYDLDMGQEQKVQEIVGNIRQAIENGNWSASDREGMMKGFEQGLAEPLTKRHRVVAGEQAWIQSIDDVYDYAARNHSVFVMNNGQVAITDNQVLTEFNSKVQAMNARRNDFMLAKRDFDQWQAQLFQKMGVSGKDVGMQ